MTVSYREAPPETGTFFRLEEYKIVKQIIHKLRYIKGYGNLSIIYLKGLLIKYFEQMHLLK